MAWSAPMTAVANTAFTAAQFNQYVRDNLLETAPALATEASEYFVATGLNTVVARRIMADYVGGEVTTTSESYTALDAGPSVTVDTGSHALVEISCGSETDASSSGSFMSFEVSGASSISPGDFLSVNNWGSDRRRFGRSFFLDSLTAGSNTFTARYKSSSSSDTATFVQRRIHVIPF